MADSTKKSAFALYAINQVLEALLDRIDEAETPIPDDEMVAALLAIEADQTTRFDQIRRAVLNEAAKANAYKEEADRLSAHAARHTLHVEKLKAFLVEQMGLAGLQKIEFPTGGSLRIQKNGGQETIELSVEPEALGKEWRKEKVEYSVDREAVYGAIEAGIPLPATIKVFRGSHLRLA